MSTLNKLSYLNETKGLIKESLNTNFNSQIEDTDTFRSYVQKIDNIYNNWPKISDENEKIDIVNTRKGKITFQLKGNGGLKTYTGKNLFDSDTVIPNSIGSKTYIVYDKKTKSFTMTNQSSDTYFPALYGNAPKIEGVNIQLKKNTTYIISCTADQTIRWGVYALKTDDTYQNISGLVSTATITFNSGEYENFAIRFGSTLAKGTITHFSNIQIEEGDTKSSYEPYTGGTPSPNPSYPQKIEIVNGNNKIKVCGKNLFDKNDIVDGYYIATDGTIVESSGKSYTNYIRVTPNTQYIISGKTAWTVTACYDSDKNFISRFNDVNSFTTGANTYYIRTVLDNNDINTIQIEKNSTATTYEEFCGKTYNIDLPVENLFNADSIIPAMIVNKGTSYADNLIYNNTTKTLTMINKNNDTYLPSISGNHVYINNININVEPNTDYVWSFKIDQSLSTMKCSIMGFDEDAQQYKYIKGFTQSDTFYFNSGKYKQITFRLGSTAPTNTITHFSEFQLAKGTEKNTYHSYGTQVIELCKIGNSQDYFYKENNNWYKYNAIGERTYKGASDENWGYSTSQVGFYIDVSNKSSSSRDNFITSHYYIVIPESVNVMPTGTATTNVNNKNRLVFKDTRYTTTEGLKTWLQSHWVTVKYVLETPNSTLITDQTLINQLNQMEKDIKSCDNQTNISQLNNNNAFIINVDILKKNS